MTKLAINGGTPVYDGKFPTWPIWGEKEEKNLLTALDNGEWGTLGKFAMGFANRFAGYIGVEYAIAMNTGTQALEMMLRACGIGRGDEVIVPPYTFVATISAVAYVGAVPVFADVDLSTGCIDAASVRERVTEKTKAILAVHMAGRPCDMDALRAVADEKGVLLLEDAAHAHGSEWRGKRCGALGDAAAFSFQGSKVLTGGEGGMVVTNNRDIYARCWHYHTSGRALEGSGEFGGVTLMGTNARMAEWEAAILDAQMDRLPAQCEHRAQSAARLTEKLSGVPGVELCPADDRITAFNGFIYLFRWVGEGMTRDEFIAAVNAEGIPCSAGYRPISDMAMLYDETFERSTGVKYGAPAPCPKADELSRTAVWLASPVLMAEDAVIDKVAEAIAKVAANA